MNDVEYRAFLDLLMCSDPWPVVPGDGNQDILIAFADREAENRGYENWVVAYHEIPGQADD